MHAQGCAGSQLAARGSQVTLGAGARLMFCTQPAPSGHCSQVATTSQYLASMQRPDQQAGVVSAMVPGSQGGGSESQATLLASQLSRGMVHTPRRQTALSMPSALHSVWSHASLQVGTSTPTGTPAQSQQSSASIQSASLSQTALVPVSVLLSVLLSVVVPVPGPPLLVVPGSSVVAVAVAVVAVAVVVVPAVVVGSSLVAVLLLVLAVVAVVVAVDAVVDASVPVLVVVPVPGPQARRGSEVRANKIKRMGEG